MGRSVQYPIARFDDDKLRAAALAYMQRWKLSQRDFNAATGMSHGQTSRWLRGEHRAGPDFIVSIAYVCDLDLNQFIVLEDEDEQAAG